MSDIKNLIELNDLINNGNSLRGDLSEAAELIKTMFKQKYISKLENELKIQKQIHQKNPTKEIQLIQAVKPFINSERHKEIDSITDTLINITTLMDIQKDFIKNNEKEKDEEPRIKAMDTILTEKNDPSIKKDGIYDIDESCLLTKQSSGKNTSSNFLIYSLFAIILFSIKQ
ncbi:MAG: hypothetical protein HFE59_00350 [Clostridiales bacterium]|jgi:hypothetical protein|nr:hypothetical protein [Clostridiales bacterium]